tara:strand:- start:69 stop:194 length:126 start_codon:yes stop_codon:yes gene_type:complete
MRIFETAFEETESTLVEAKEDARRSSRERLLRCLQEPLSDP